MSAKPLHARATIGGHPIHPMLVSFPIAFYTAALVALIVYAVNGSVFAYTLSYLGFLTGAAMAVIAAVFGAIDLFNIPQTSPARRTGLVHMALNLTATVLFFAAGLMIFADRNQPHAMPALILALVGIASTLAAGWMGWKLVQTHHIGVDERPAGVREPRSGAARWHHR